MNRPKLFFYPKPENVGWLGWIEYEFEVRFMDMEGRVTKAYPKEMGEQNCLKKEKE